MDFNNFDNQWRPITLIRKFFAGELWYMGNSKFYSIGKQRSELDYEYLRFGKSTNSYTVYLYDKSRELMEEKDKPYIREIWRKVGLDVDRVWRLELSLRCDIKNLLYVGGKIKKTKLGLVDELTGEILTNDVKTIETKSGIIRCVEPINVDVVSNKEDIMSLYMRIIAKVFRFRFKDKRKKFNCTPVPIIKVNENDKNYRPYRLPSSKAYGRKEKMIAKYLDELVRECPEVRNEAFKIRMKLQEIYAIELREHSMRSYDKNPSA